MNKFSDAPEEIFLQVCSEDCDEPYETHLDGVTWCADRINKSDVRYVRADLIWAKDKSQRHEGRGVDN